MSISQKKFPSPTLVFFAFVIIILVASMMTHRWQTFFRDVKRIFKPSTTDQEPNVTLLAWTSFWGKYSYFPQKEVNLCCPNYNCLFTNDRALLSRSDAIIFHWWDINDKNLPMIYKKSAKWILFNYEPPTNSPWASVEAIISKVNLVVTYRSDSDIVDTYGFVRPRQASDPVDVHDITLKDFQTKDAVVWVVSNCKTASKREDYVRQLKKYIDVKVYGKCGSAARCQNIPYINCYAQMAKLYKFYLAFENSICADYATEKVFYPLLKGIVPVVMGGANYSQMLPPNSYINALDFRSPKDLADYLHKVGSNFTLYKSYHDWRKDFVVANGLSSSKWMCKLCSLIHENRVSDSTKNKNSFYHWWYDDAKCTNVSDKILSST